MKNNIEVINEGLQCDNPNCDWKDETIKHEDYINWINKTCPLCGENILTEEDYNFSLHITKSIDFVNSLSEDQINAYNELIGIKNIEDLKKLNIKSLEHVNDLNEKVIIKISKNKNA